MAHPALLPCHSQHCQKQGSNHKMNTKMLHSTCTASNLPLHNQERRIGHSTPVLHPQTGADTCHHQESALNPLFSYLLSTFQIQWVQIYRKTRGSGWVNPVTTGLKGGQEATPNATQPVHSPVPPADEYDAQSTTTWTF